MPLFGCFLKPRCGLLTVLRHTYSLCIHRSQKELRVGMPLIGCFLKPRCRLLIILRHASAVEIQQTQIMLCANNNALLGKRLH